MIRELPELETHALGRTCIFLEEVDSTNNYLKENGSGLPHGTAVIAQRQTGGKGRLGRRWVSEAGEGLYLSVLVKGLDTSDMPRLPLMVGLGVSRGLTRLCGRECPIKWSNDVLCGDKKICGILCESRLRKTEQFAVAGIGVNLLQSENALTESGLVYATSLHCVTKNIFTLEQTAAAILNSLETVLQEYQQCGFGPVKQAYKQACVTLGRQVRILEGDGGRLGTATDIADDGALVCIDSRGELFTVHAGETSVRGLYGYI